MFAVVSSWGVGGGDIGAPWFVMVCDCIVVLEDLMIVPTWIVLVDCDLDVETLIVTATASHLES
jgi:hypothetical protein